MKRELKHKSGEPLYEWLDRIAPEVAQMSPELLRETLGDISKVSYIEGTNAALSILKKR